MGKFDFQVSPDFLKQLGRLQDVDRVAPMMIDEAIPILETNVKKELSLHRVTGSMANSIKRSKAKATRNGGYIANVYPTGKDEKGVRNMEKLVYLEYGTSKQAAVPTLTKAINDSESAALNKMQEVFNREMSK